jgi:urease accessory protein UreF
MEAFEKAIQNKEANSHYCIVFGVYAYLMKIPLYEALLGFYYTSVAGMITNAVKLVPLGQLDGQDIFSHCIRHGKNSSGNHRTGQRSGRTLQYSL